MVLFMKMKDYRKDGFNMYAKLLRLIVKTRRQMAGHCDGDGGGGYTGHCY